MELFSPVLLIHTPFVFIAHFIARSIIDIQFLLNSASFYLQISRMPFSTLAAYKKMAGNSSRLWWSKEFSPKPNCNDITILLYTYIITFMSFCTWILSSFRLFVVMSKITLSNTHNIQATSIISNISIQLLQI